MSFTLACQPRHALDNSDPYVQAERQGKLVMAKPSIIEERWTKTIAKAGWTVLPSIVLDKQAVLKLTPRDINVLMQIIKHWFEADEKPFPAVGTIAAAMGVQKRTVQRSLAKMVEQGYIEKQKRTYAKGGQKSNGYSFGGLIKACTPFAEETLAMRDEKKKKDAARIRRKFPAAPPPPLLLDLKVVK